MTDHISSVPTVDDHTGVSIQSNNIVPINLKKSNELTIQSSVTSSLPVSKKNTGHLQKVKKNSTANSRQQPTTKQRNSVLN